MFEKDYFQEAPASGPTKTGRAVGNIGLWGLHAAAITFALYSGYHGISATSAYRAGSGLGMAAGIIGILTVETVLMSLYFAWHNGRIVGPAQSIAAGVTGAIGFALASLAIVADSQLNAGVPLSPWLSAYLLWGLPLSPAVMAAGALFTHELAPGQLRARREAVQREELDELQFTAHIAARRAEMESARVIANLQLNAKANAAQQIASWYHTDDAQRAITRTAMSNAPALLKAIGIEVEHDHTPAADDGPKRVSYAEMRERIEQSGHGPNGNGATRPI